jgi:uncharacterized protein
MGKKKILIAGGTGLIGQRMLEVLKNDYEITILSRKSHTDKNGFKYALWDTDKMYIDEKVLDADIIINLSGAGIADSRWSTSRKKELIESRTKPIQTLIKVFEKSERKPEFIINASAVGFFGDRADEILTENSPAGDGFLAECTKIWEQEAHKMEAITNRLAMMRIGIVLSCNGGALPKFLMTKSLKLFNYFGHGRQFYPWIHIDDVVGAFRHLIENAPSKGIYNLSSPIPLSNKELMTKVAESTGGGLVFPVPAFTLRLAMGEMADVVLNSTNAIPQRLMEEGFKFQFPKIKEAIHHLLSNKV